MTPSPELAHEYAAQLATHMTGTSEAVLLRAYELGRRGIGEGLGILDVITLHHRALRRLVASDPAGASGEMLDKAAAFVAECLSPFEMQLRGYQESNAHLVAANELLHQAKAQTEAANRDLEAFSYSVAHDLRAPLRSIDGFSLALLEDCAPRLAEDERKYLGYVRESAQRMGRLIDDLLMLARVTRRELRRDRVDLSALAEAVIAELRHADPGRNVTCVVAPGLVATGDRGLLKIVLDNLLANAWKFTGKAQQPRIELASLAQDRPTIFFVRDNGAGFDMRYQAKLFGVFQRLHSAGEFEGTGIGLAIVQRIVAKHGGRIWAEGEPGRGATFYFTFDDGGDPA